MEVEKDAERASEGKMEKKGSMGGNRKRGRIEG